MSDLTLGIDLGGTHMRAAVVDEDGRLLAHRVEPTPHQIDSLDGLIQLSAEVIAKRSLSHAVVGVPGPVDYGRGRMLYAPNLGTGWLEHLTAGGLSQALGVPVWLANDADLAAVGEAGFGAGRNFEDFVYITVSTGVGAAAIMGHQLVHGLRSALEIGHTVVDWEAEARREASTVEELASGTAIAHQAVAIGLPADSAQVVALAHRGDIRAQQIVDRASAVAAVAVLNLCQLLAPQAVILGGGVGLSGTLTDPISDLLGRKVDGPLGRLPELLLADLGDDAALAGSAAWPRFFRVSSGR